MNRVAVALALLSFWATPTFAAELCGSFSTDVDDRSGPPVLFWSDMSADEETAVTESPGKGHAEFSLDRKTLRLSWTLTFQGLDSQVLGIGLYGPAPPGNEGGLIYDLGKERAGNAAKGSVVVQDSDVTNIVHDKYYVNITTKKYPRGELRGPIKRHPPKC